MVVVLQVPWGARPLVLPNARLARPPSALRKTFHVLVVSSLLLLPFRPWENASLALKLKHELSLPIASTLSRPSRFTIPPKWHDWTAKQPYGEPQVYPHSPNRVYLSSIPREGANGLGHRFTMASYDLTMATYLGVSNVHRRPRYGSLSPDNDPMAAERLLGWASISETRESFLKQHCLEEVRRPQRMPTCGMMHHRLVFCVKLRPDSPFKHLVQVPAELADCVAKSARFKNSLPCAPALRQFADQHNETGTIFYLESSPNVCFQQALSVDFDQIGRWLRRQYWNFHRHTTVLSKDAVINGGSITRVLPLEEDRLQIAVHIRRGDFFNYSRPIVPDYAFADVIAATKNASNMEYGQNVPTTVSIFSEGVAKNGVKGLSMHDMGAMDPIYLTDKAERIHDAEAHWKKLLMNRLKSTENIQIRTYIATDTINAVNTMICADVFIGSKSSLSLNVVETLGRGMVVAPALPGTVPRKAKNDTLRFVFGFGRVGETTEVRIDELRKGLRKLLGHAPWEK